MHREEFLERHTKVTKFPAAPPGGRLLSSYASGSVESVSEANVIRHMDSFILDPTGTEETERRKKEEGSSTRKFMTDASMDVSISLSGLIVSVLF